MRMLPILIGAALWMAAPPAGAPRADDAHPHVSPPAAAATMSTAPADDPDSGAEMLGRPAPEWTFTRWVGAPLRQDRLHGKVVLLRWWTEGCHYCATTLPVIEDLRRKHAADGLVVIGVFHPKPPREVSDGRI